MAVRKFLAAVCSAAVVGAAMLASAGTASAQPPFGGFPYPQPVPFNPYTPNINFTVPLGNGFDQVQIGPQGVFQNIVTPNGQVELFQGKNGHGFEIIQQNGGVPIVLPY